MTMLKTKVKPVFKYSSIFALLVFIDQISKLKAYSGKFADFLNLLRPVLGKQIFPNYYFAFSLKLPITLIYLIYGLLLLVLVGFLAKNFRNKRLVLACVFILAGAFSNIFDRLTLGYVRDFIYIFWGNVFNMADLFILFGIGLFLKEK